MAFMKEKPLHFVTVTFNPAWDIWWQTEAPLRRGCVHTIRKTARVAGGKGVNVAKLLAANGRRVTAGGWVGEEDAETFLAEVRARGIAAAFHRAPGRTRENLMVRGANGEMKFNHPGFPSVRCDFASVLRYMRALTEKADVVALCGSLPAGFPPDTYARLIRDLHRRGVATALDTSGEALIRGIAAGPTLIKPNRAELEEIAGRPLRSETAVRREIERLRERVEAVVVTDGAAGAWFAVGEVRLWGRPPPVRAADSTGAGDAFLGQLIGEYFPARRLTEEIAARALAAGAAAAERPGSTPVSPERVTALASRVKIAAYTPRGV